MKTKKFRTVLLFIAVLVFSLQNLNAQNGKLTKEYHEEFKVSESTSLSLENKFGNIDIKDWDQNTIKIDVIVSVKHSNPDKAEKLLSYIDVHFDVDGDAVSAKTVFDERFSKASGWRNGDNEIQVDYTVQMPKDLQVNVSNKYGDVFISELTGPSVISVKYGNLKANRIYKGKEKPLSEINLGYSSGYIEECNWLKINIKYSKLEIDNSMALVLMSAYSKIYVDKVSSIVMEGKYDTYELGEISNLVTNTSYSNLKINRLTNKLEAESKYTDCKIEEVPAGFESIDIETKYGGFKIGVAENASYNLDGMANYAKISFHETGKVSKIQENTSMKVFGLVGKDENTSSKIKINTKYGSVRLDY